MANIFMSSKIQNELIYGTFLITKEEKAKTDTCHTVLVGTGQLAGQEDNKCTAGRW